MHHSLKKLSSHERTKLVHSDEYTREKILMQIAKSNFIKEIHFKGNVVHHDTQPAIIYANGTQHWIKNGFFHRDDGPAIILPDGTKAWYKNGKYHREDGPAITWGNGIQEWWYYSARHREDGPAITFIDGSKEWFLHGIRYDTFSLWIKSINLPEDEKLVLILKYG